MKYGLLFAVISHLVFFSYGWFAHKLSWFPATHLRALKAELENQDGTKAPLNPEIKLIDHYLAGMPLFSDRVYYDRLKNTALNGTALIQMPRHLEGQIEIRVFKPVNLYRAFCDKNYPHHTWTVTEIEILVEGASHSCTHTGIVKKTFNKPGSYLLTAGGNVSSDPIFIEWLPTKREDVFSVTLYNAE